MPGTEVGSPERVDSGSVAAPVAPGITLGGVSWSLYHRMRSLEANRRTRMTYLDGTLILMSPEYRHDRPVVRLTILIWEVAKALGVEIEPIGTTTLRRQGQSPRRGSGKEADNAFYVGATELRIRGKDAIDLTVDPPPDLAIEVENKADARLVLAAYARIGVPELWLFRVRDETLRFLGFAGGEYRPIGRSVAFPRLTPGLVSEALAVRSRGMGMLGWSDWLRGWIRDLPDPPVEP